MNPSQIKATLQELGGSANKALGQHFLIDASALTAIVTAAAIRPDEQILEIGPGLGVLTDALLQAGARVRAIEQDRRYIPFLEQRFHAYGDHFCVMHGDAARMPWQDILEPGSWKLVSNLPYSITSLALRLSLWSPSLPEKVVVLIQREVAERATSLASDVAGYAKGKTSLLSLMVALASQEAKIVKRVPAGAFFPPPKVESAILALTPQSWQEREEYWNISVEAVMKLAKQGFAHPRKFLASNLGLSRDQQEGLQKQGILIPGVRAEALSPRSWASLTRALG